MFLKWLVPIKIVHLLQIYARNSTRVSKIIQSIVRSEDLNITNFLEGSGPLEMLFEIGVEKLKRDYLFTILNNYLATRHSGLFGHFPAHEKNYFLPLSLHEIFLIPLS